MQKAPPPWRIKKEQAEADSWQATNSQVPNFGGSAGSAGFGSPSMAIEREMEMERLVEEATQRADDLRARLQVRRAISEVLSRPPVDRPSGQWASQG